MPINESLICPQCAKPIVSRMSKKCNWCSAELPEHLRLSDAEIHQINAEEKAVRQEKIDAEKAKEAKRLKDIAIEATVECASHLLQVPLSKLTGKK